jgi:osmotically-inducible protein OsmY
MKTTLKSMVLASLVAAGLGGVTGCDRYDNGENASGTERTAGQQVDDEALASSVKSALNNDTMKFPDVKVSVYKGTVQLSGFANTSEQRSQAAEVAGRVPNVQKVENNITLKP